ncbi:MAG: fibronectin type III domain-containing protein [Thermodesulfobacteriota bacterium]|nr:fibronectin type III domain-containing protein [Thermodesulfobacteriota bacterium]
MQRPASVLAKTMLQALVLLLLLSGTPAFSGELSLRWNSNRESDIAGYKLHYGSASRDYECAVDVGSETSYTLSGLQGGRAYYCAASAYDTQGNESDLSEEVVHVVQSVDSDDDGILDDDETDIYGTDPTMADTDGDGLNDGEELAFWQEGWGADADNSGNCMVAYKDGVAIDYGSLGLWYFDSVDWIQLGTADPEWLCVYGDKLVVDYGSDYGLKQYDGVSWGKLGAADADNSGNCMVAYKDGVAVDYGSLGLWYFDGIDWIRLGTADPEWLCVYGDNLVVDYGSDYGLKQYDGVSWGKLGAADADNSGNCMVAYKDGVAIDYGSLGLWYCDDGAGWTQLGRADPQWLYAYNDDLAIDYGDLGFSEIEWYRDDDNDGWVNLLDPDSDGDGYLDGEEIAAGSDPSDPYSDPSAVAWRDYRISLTMGSNDNDAVGLMFRYQDADNYYRFSWDRQRYCRRLVKCENGVFTLLAEDSVSYVTGESYDIEVVAEGSSLEVFVDDALIFSVADESLPSGTIGLYSWANQGSLFDEIVVEDLSTGVVVLWDDFGDGDYGGWSVVDEGIRQGPSAWSAESGVLVQRANIHSGPTDRAALSKLGTFVVYDD